MELEYNYYKFSVEVKAENVKLGRHNKTSPEILSEEYILGVLDDLIKYDIFRIETTVKMSVGQFTADCIVCIENNGYIESEELIHIIHRKYEKEYYEAEGLQQKIVVMQNKLRDLKIYIDKDTLKKYNTIHNCYCKIHHLKQLRSKVYNKIKGGK